MSCVPPAEKPTTIRTGEPLDELPAAQRALFEAGYKIRNDGFHAVLPVVIQMDATLTKLFCVARETPVLSCKPAECPRCALRRFLIGSPRRRSPAAFPG
jgi:hypothetical protein